MMYSIPSVSLNISALCRNGVLLALLALLSACAGNQPTKSESREDKPVKLHMSRVFSPPIPVSPEIRADFSAAMDSAKSEEYEKAIKLLEKVIAQMPNNPVPYINLAMVYNKMQNLPLAEENLKKAIKIDPENPVANNEYALLYRKTGRFVEARQTYEKILEIYPDYRMARKNLGILCDIYMRDYECARKHYTIYSDLMPDDAAVKNWIADLKGR